MRALRLTSGSSKFLKANKTIIPPSLILNRNYVYASKFFRDVELVTHFSKVDSTTALVNCNLTILLMFVSSKGIEAVSIIYKTQPSAHMSNIFGSYDIP